MPGPYRGARSPFIKVAPVLSELTGGHVAASAVFLDHASGSLWAIEVSQYVNRSGVRMIEQSASALASLLPDQIDLPWLGRPAQTALQECPVLQIIVDRVRCRGRCIRRIPWAGNAGLVLEYARGRTHRRVLG